VRLAGKHELDGTLRVIEDPLEPLRIAEEQRRPLVGCETARKADGQRMWVKPCGGCVDVCRRRASAQQLCSGALAHQCQHLHLSSLVLGPQCIGRNIRDARPGRSLVDRVAPIGSQVPIQQGRKARMDPGVRMDPIGDMIDRHFSFGQAGPQ